MSLFTIDESRCKKDGICVEECPIGVIFDFTNTEQVPEPEPEPVKELEFLCMNCGHCVAVWPQAALTHQNLSPDDCIPVNRNMTLSPEQTEHFLRSRRSIRKYKAKALGKETIERIISLASHAPSAHNMQPVQWQVILGREKIKELTALVVEGMEHMQKTSPELSEMLHLGDLANARHAGEDIICRDAPAIVLANGFVGDSFSENVIKIAMTYLDLAILSFGLRSQWNGFVQMATAAHKPLQEALEYPANFTNYDAMLVGYPRYKYHRMPTRNEPRITWVA